MEGKKDVLDKYLELALDENLYVNDNEKYTVKRANMYLASDRLLSFEVFTRENYILKFVPDALAWFFFKLLKIFSEVVERKLGGERDNYFILKIFFNF